MTQNMLSLKRVLIWGQYFSYIDQDRWFLGNYEHLIYNGI
jgi:hypothetical protein